MPDKIYSMTADTCNITRSAEHDDRAWAEWKAAMLARPEVEAMIRASVEGLSPPAAEVLHRLENSFHEYLEHAKGASPAGGCDTLLAVLYEDAEYAEDTGDYGPLRASLVRFGLRRE